MIVETLHSKYKLKVARKTGLKLRPAASNTSKKDIRYRKTQSRSLFCCNSFTAERNTMRWARAVTPTLPAVSPIFC
jgi:hypothetical protein